MNKQLIFFPILILLFANEVFSEPSISPFLYFIKNAPESKIAKKVYNISTDNVNVTLKFNSPPSNSIISEIETHGITFKRYNGKILHSEHIYPAVLNPESLESLKYFNEIVSVESSFNPSMHSTLDVSNPLVQADKVWNLSYNSFPVDGHGVIIADVDTGVDIYNPSLFFTGNKYYSWIDENKNGFFDNGDYVDLNSNGLSDPDESLKFYNSPFSDQYGILQNDFNIFNADIDWLYNDKNGNSIRDYGLSSGYNEKSDSFGEQIFLVNDTNRNNILDTGEKLISLTYSKILGVYDKSGEHLRGYNLFTATPDYYNHGTPAVGIAGGGYPGRKFTGMAPGAEFLIINKDDGIDISEGILWAVEKGAKIIMYEYGSWIFEFLDGSSNIETLINDLYNKGIHQFTAAGNLAGPTRKKHAYLSLDYNQSDSLYFSVPQSYKISEVYLSILWRNDLLYRPSITLNIPGESSIKFMDGVTTYNSGIYKIQVGGTSSSKGTSRFDIMISAETSFSGNFSLFIKNNRRISLDFHAYIADNVTSWVNGAQFQNFVTDDGTVCSPGTAEKGIDVGAFDPRGYRNEKGSLCDFSSWGNTIDGRRAVDITAPGFTVFSPSSSLFSDYIPGGYVDFGGTSAALPFVTGCAALILQASPDISPDNLENALINFTETDNFTGIVPNNKWGYGKLKIYDSITKSKIISFINDLYSLKMKPFSISEPFPNPFNNKTYFNISLNDKNIKNIKLNIYNVSGQLIKEYNISGGNLTNLSWDGKDGYGRNVGSGVYFINVLSNNFNISKKVILLR